MKKTLCRLTIMAGCVLLGLSSYARPLQRADVGADPAWLVHLDFDGLRSTTIGAYIQTEMNKPEAQAKLAAFQALFSFDLRTQLHGVTLYGPTTSPKDAVVLVYVDADPNRLITLAQAAKDAQNTTYKQHTIYSWVDEKAHHGSTHRIYAAMKGARVIFGQREDSVGRALDVLDGASSSLAASQVFPQLGATGDTSYIEAAARKLDFAASNPNAAMLRLSKLIRFQLAEAQQQVSATLTLEADDEEVAANMASIGNGLISLMRLQKEKPEAVKFAEALSLKQNDAEVAVSLKLPAGQVIEMIKADAARKAKKEADSQAH